MLHRGSRNRDLREKQETFFKTCKELDVLGRVDLGQRSG